MQRTTAPDSMADADGRARCYAYGSSSYRGVRLIEYNSGRQRATAFIFYRNKQKYIGTFDSEEEAARNYDLAAVALRGEKAIKALNFPEDIDRYKQQAPAVAAVLLQGGTRPRSKPRDHMAMRPPSLDQSTRAPKRPRSDSARAADAALLAARVRDPSTRLALQVSRAAAAAITQVSDTLARVLAAEPLPADATTVVIKATAGRARAALASGSLPDVGDAPAAGSSPDGPFGLAPPLVEAMEHSVSLEAARVPARGGTAPESRLLFPAQITSPSYGSDTTLTDADVREILAASDVAATVVQQRVSVFLAQAAKLDAAKRQQQHKPGASSAQQQHAAAPAPHPAPTAVPAAPAPPSLAPQTQAMPVAAAPTTSAAPALAPAQPSASFAAPAPPQLPRSSAESAPVPPPSLSQAGGSAAAEALPSATAPAAMAVHAMPPAEATTAVAGIASAGTGVPTAAQVAAAAAALVGSMS